MVSTSSRSLNRFINTLLVMGFVAFTVSFCSSIDSLAARRNVLQQIAERRCQQDEKQACQSVYADIRSAAAAEDMVDLAIWQFLVGIAGIILVAFTLKATQDAVREANDATKAAEKAIELTREGMRHELRAYLTVSGAQAAVEERGRRIIVRWRNGGQTPAIRVKGFLKATLADSLPPHGYNFPITQLESGGPMPVGPGEEYITATPSLLPFEAFWGDHPNRKKVVVWGYVEYSDIFAGSEDRRWRTECAYEVQINMDDRSDPISFVPLWQHNGMDAECVKQPGD